MAATDKKMILFCILAFFSNVFIVLISLIKDKKTAKHLSDAISKIALLENANKDIWLYLNKVHMGDIILTENLKKIFMALNVLKINNPPAIQLTILKILDSEKALTPRETSVLLLKNLLDEYNSVKVILKAKETETDDLSDKNKLSSVVSELDTMINLISTISEESSDSYIEQIFNEIIASSKKIRDI
jgi:hypothetical protein